MVLILAAQGTGCSGTLLSGVQAQTHVPQIYCAFMELGPLFSSRQLDRRNHSYQTGSLSRGLNHVFLSPSSEHVAHFQLDWDFLLSRAF